MQTKITMFYKTYDILFAYPTNFPLITVYSTYSQRMTFKCLKCRLVLHNQFLYVL